jgi:hypothetical protein
METVRQKADEEKLEKAILNGADVRLGHVFERAV